MHTDKENEKRKIRVLLCVSEIDGHDRGVRHIAKKLAEAGMEVVYTTYGISQQITDTAIQEDVDVIGISSSTGGHLSVVSDLTTSLEAEGKEDKLILVGGVIPDADISNLLQMGVGKVFGPGTIAQDVVKYIIEYFSQTK